MDKEKTINTIQPEEQELPSHFAYRLGEYYATLNTAEHKKVRGQFFTPLEIASFMTSLMQNNKSDISILDPGCGTGILSVTLIENLVEQSPIISNIELVGYEIDTSLIQFCELSLQYLNQWLKSRKISLSYRVSNLDFILENRRAIESTHDLFGNLPERYDFIVSNPPFFKLSKDDPRTKAAKSVVNGHANIYSIFMAISASLLKPQGQLVFIIPRSFCSGNYFQAFREFFFTTVDIVHAHLFHSRRSIFGKDNVLQEMIIVKCVPKDTNIIRSNVSISSSQGLSDLCEVKIQELPARFILDYESSAKILFLPTNDEEKKIIKLFSTFEGSLNKYGFQISTGPVVDFRSTEYIIEEGDLHNELIAPLFWLHNVHKMDLKWPLKKKSKGQYIIVDNKSMPLLVRNKNYIFIRRFSSKDDKSRLIAAPYFSNAISSKFIGIENRVNYIYKPIGNLNRIELVGLTALLNSELFDKYFRILNGNVNVSSTELKLLPLPSLEKICAVGNELILKNAFSLTLINEIVNDKLEFKPVSIANDQD